MNESESFMYFLHDFYLKICKVRTCKLGLYRTKRVYPVEKVLRL